MEILWKAFAWVVSRPKVADYLIRRSQRTPYFHLPGYMNRWWLFNAYDSDTSKPEDKRHGRKCTWLPSVRIHHILRADTARDLHDHPWNARTIILKGSYVERRRVGMKLGVSPIEGCSHMRPVMEPITETHARQPGDTATINYGQYHSIDAVSDGGVYTMFFTWKYMGGWGFLVNGVKVPWRQYEEENGVG